MFLLHVIKSKHYLTTAQKNDQTSSHCIMEKHLGKALGKKQQTLFLYLFYTFCHFLKLRAVKTLSEQFPEFQTFQFPVQTKLVCPLSMHTKHF